MPISIKNVGREINPQFATLVESSDSVIICSFVIQLPNVDSASFDIIYPLQTLKPIASLLRSRVNSDVVEDDKTWRERLQNSVLNITLPIDKVTLWIDQIWGHSEDNPSRNPLKPKP